MNTTLPKQSRLTGAIALVIAQAVVLMFGYATHLWIGRVLGPGPYGVYGVVLSLQVVLGIFLNLGVPSAVSRFVAQDEVHAQAILNQALRLQVLFGAAIGILTLIASPLISAALQDKGLTPYIAFVGAVVFLQAFYPVYVQFFSGLHRFNRQALITIIYATAKLVGAIGLIYSFQVFGAFAGFAIGGIVAALLGWWWTRDIPKSAKTSLSMRSFLSFAGMYVLVLAGLQILMSLDLFMVKSILKNDVQAGYYNAAVTLSRISYFLLQGLSFIILPSVSALTKPGASQHEAKAFIRKIIRYLIMLIVPSITLAAATSKELVILFFSRQYIPSAGPLAILMLGLGALAFFLLLVNIAAGAGKGRFALGATLTMIAGSATLGTVLIPRFGLMGAAWQTTSVSFIGLAALVWYIFRTFQIRFPAYSIFNVVVATVVAVLPTYIWKASSIILPIQYIVLLGIYVIVLFVLREITPDDRAQIARVHPALSFLAPQKD